MSESHVADLVRALGSTLRRRGFDGHADVLDGVRPDPVPMAPTSPTGLAVLDQLAESCTAAVGVDPALVDLVQRVAPTAAWTQTAAYLERPPSPDFLDGYAHATLVGPPDGELAGSREPGVSVGLLLLGRDVHYPPHHHPADEVYLPLGDADWLDDDATTYRTRPAGTPLHHRPWQPHAMRTGSRPLLAVYLWTGEVTTASRWCA